MTTKSIAVAVIHGMGRQETSTPDPVTGLRFSEGLRRKLDGAVDGFRQNVAFEEIFWADIMGARQEAYLARVGARVSRGLARDFVVRNLADAAGYSSAGVTSDNRVYDIVHARVRFALRRLRDQVGPDAPLIVVAHSLGAHVMSNYIYDLQSGSATGDTPLERFRTVAAFVTFGCNIPVLTFALPYEDIEAIEAPWQDLAAFRRFRPWWHNMYDRDDVLGYPLAPCGRGYEMLAANQELADYPVRVGGLLTAWNPLSHGEYWTARSVYDPIAALIRRQLDARA